jgi:hypothetical protein
MLIQSCNGDDKIIIHKGEKRMVTYIENDSLFINASNTSGRGNFYMMDSVITYADTYYSTLFHYDIHTGACFSQHFRKGNGPNELSAFLHAYPAYNRKQVYILDHSNLLFGCDEKYDLLKHGHISFEWNNTVLSSSDFESPSNYNVMEMSDFGINMGHLNDSIVILPVNIIKRYTSDGELINKKHYSNGRIFGELNLKTMKIEKVFGRFPEIYKTSPVPHLEFFQYAMDKETIYVNHAVDSLIYVYKYPETLLYTIGYECNRINRGYKTTKVIDEALFAHDMQRTGINTGLKYIPRTNSLIRTYMTNLVTGESGLQIYKDNDLIGEFEMPPFYIFLGYYNGIYYGVRMVPIEDESETHFVFYKTKIHYDQLKFIMEEHVDGV